MRILKTVCILLLSFNVLAQTTDFPIGHLVYQQMEFEDLKNSTSFSSTVKPFDRSNIIKYIKPESGSYLSLEGREYTIDSTKSNSPFLKKLYKYPSDAFSYNDQQLDLHINPVLQVALGNDSNVSETLFTTSRGIEVRGTIDKKVAFYTTLTENQARYPQYVRNVIDTTLAVPYEGFWKQYNETGVDFFRAQGYVDFGVTQSISAQLGFGKHFIGNGIRSMMLSDFANNYPYLRVNTETKLFDYTNIFAELISDIDGGVFGIRGSGNFHKKYMAMHHLNIKIKPNFHIGLFESVMYGDSTQGLKVEYLNPVIFYRAIEQQNASADNAFVGMDFKWNIRERYSLYGQLVIDEMIVSEVFSGNGWWGNKQGIQLGIKYIDALGIDNLMLQGEFNKARPYTYAHESGFTSYSHYHQPMAHPFGANFTEYLGRALYHLNDQWFFESIVLLAKYGNDIGSVNYGRDILKNYTERIPNGTGGSLEFGNDHLQGNQTDLTLLFFRTSYMWKHNFFIDFDATFRGEKDSEGLIDTSSSIFALSFRWNVPSRRYLF